MWMFWLMLGASAGTCTGYTMFAIANAAKSDAEEQRLSDEAELDFMRKWRAAQRR